jgi:hypothetical protein
MRRRGPRKADGGGARSRSSDKQLCAWEGGKQKGKRASEDPHPKVELQRQQRSGEAAATTVTETRRQ